MKRDNVQYIIDTINIDEFIDDYMHQSNKFITNKYNISKNTIFKLKKIYNIPDKPKELVDYLKIKGREDVINELGDRDLYFKQVSNKVKSTKQLKYGDCNYNNPTKMQNTKEILYGDKNYVNSEKAKSTKIEKYGSLENFYKARQLKTKETKITRYGSLEESYKLMMRHLIQTNQEKYGRKYGFDYDKSISTTQLKYGVSNISKLDIIKDKKKSTMSYNYGDIESAYKLISSKTKLTKFIKYGNSSYNNISKALQTFYIKYGKDFTSKLHRKISKYNLKFAEILDAYHIEYSMEFSLCNRSFDFKVGNLLIELDPSITHNSTYNIFGGNPLTKTYHKYKTELAYKNNYNCIHVWDWDDQEKVINLLLPKTKLYARNCDISYIESNVVTNDFLNQYHLQGTCKNQSICLGLYYDNELIEVMTFGKPRYNKNYQYELLRLCTKAGYRVIGGAEKLFKYFIEIYKPQSIVSYCDLSKFTGDVYTRLDFVLKSKGSPSKHWYNIKTNQHITDNLLRQRGFDQLFGTDFGKGTSNDELMKQSNFIEIYDCGQATFVWESKFN